MLLYIVGPAQKRMQLLYEVIPADRAAQAHVAFPHSVCRSGEVQMKLWDERKSQS